MGTLPFLLIPMKFYLHNNVEEGGRRRPRQPFLGNFIALSMVSASVRITGLRQS